MPRMLGCNIDRRPLLLPLLSAFSATAVPNTYCFASFGSLHTGHAGLPIGNASRHSLPYHTEYPLCFDNPVRSGTTNRRRRRARDGRCLNSRSGGRKGIQCTDSFCGKTRGRRCNRQSVFEIQWSRCHTHCVGTNWQQRSMHILVHTLYHGSVVDGISKKKKREGQYVCLFCVTRERRLVVQRGCTMKTPNKRRYLVGTRHQFKVDNFLETSTHPCEFGIDIGSTVHGLAVQIQGGVLLHMQRLLGGHLRQ